MEPSPPDLGASGIGTKQSVASSGSTDSEAGEPNPQTFVLRVKSMDGELRPEM